MILPTEPNEFLTYFEKSGNTCIPFDKYRNKGRIWNLIKSGLIWKKGEYITVPCLYRVEKEISKKVIEHRNACSVFKIPPKKKIDKLIKAYEKMEGQRLNVDFHLAPEQAEAVHKAVQANLFILTGGPGTGKTCVLKCIQYVLETLNPDAKIVFAAPTGKAARRITESVGKPAQTIHKAMCLVSETSKPRPIFCDCIIVDEISMLDTLTADAFFMAVQTGTKIILVGDVDQLPSVGYGSVLRDLLQSNQLSCEALRVPQRQSDGSVLFQNITNIRYGQCELFQGDDFNFIPATDKNGRDVILEQYFKAVDKWGVDNVVCLTPYRRKGASCANVLNDIIQKKLNPPGKDSITVWIEDDDEANASSFRQITFCKGDPVIQLINREEIANGDVGKVVRANGLGIEVVYDGGIRVYYPPNMLDQLNLAYALSVHKSQGSEYKCVVTSALPEHKDMLCRNMVYTAITRAKKECILVGDKDTLKQGLKIEAGYARNTMLRDLIDHEGRKSFLLNALSA